MRALFSLPNLLTCVRIALTPVIVFALIASNCRDAFWLSLFAGLTDAADGYLARRMGYETRIGAYLDPIADKVLLTALYLCFGVADLVPWWLVWLVVGRQTIEMEVTPERYASDIAPARTFGFEWELDQMRNMGLIRGATLDSAVCFGRDRVMNPGGLRFKDECCRHKVLDLIGDLALIGKPLLGHVIAERAGHAMHTALVSRIMSDPSLYEVLSFDQLATRVAHALVS